MTIQTRNPAIDRANGSGPRRFRKQGRPPLRRLSRAVNCLRQAAGGYVSAAEIVDWVWRDDPDGGPSDTHYVGLIVHHLRRMGFPIVGQITRGYRYAATGELS